MNPIHETLAIPAVDVELDADVTVPAIVLADLLTPDEERFDARTGELRFNIPLLAAPVVALTDWVVEHEPVAGLPIGLFGASTGAAAALVRAAGGGQRGRFSRRAARSGG